MTYGNAVIMAGSDVTEEGWYWRTPGIPVKVKRRTDGRLWFFGFGMAGPVDDHEVPYIQWCGPMVAPLPLQGMDTVQLTHGDQTLERLQAGELPQIHGGVSYDTRRTD